MKATLDESCGSVELLEGDMALRDIIVKHVSNQTQTPNTAFYVADLGAIVWQQIRWSAHMEKVRLFYTVSCNSSPVVVQLLAALGTGFVCSKKQELELLRSIGVPSQDIILGGVCKQLSLIKYAAKHGIHMLLCENEAEVRKIARCHPTAKLLLQMYTAGCCNHEETAMSFSLTLKDCRHLLQSAKELGLNVAGVKFHVNSCCATSEDFSHAVSVARCVFDMGVDLGFALGVVDIGGGFDGTVTQLEKVNSALRPMLDSYFPEETNVSIIAEPGEYYVSAAFSLAASVISKETLARDTEHHAGDHTDLLSGNDEPQFIYRMNEGVFGSFACKLLEEPVPAPSLLKMVSAAEPLFSSSLWGPSDDSLDRVLESCLLPELSVGDWLVFKRAGASSISATEERVLPVHFFITAKDWNEIQNYSVTVETAMKNLALVPCFQKHVLSESTVMTPA